MAKTEKKLIANNKKHIMTILFLRNMKQDLCCMAQK